MFQKLRLDRKGLAHLLIFFLASMVFLQHRNLATGFVCCVVIGILFYFLFSSVRSAVVGAVAWLGGMMAVSLLPYLIAGCVVVAGYCAVKGLAERFRN